MKNSLMSEEDLFLGFPSKMWQSSKLFGTYFALLVCNGSFCKKKVINFTT